MLQQVTYTCTALKGMQVEGKIKADQHGYYRIPLGALNVVNSAGEYYPYEESKAVFDRSSLLQSRITKGQLRGELGHPKRDGMTIEQFVNRCSFIYEENVCCHIAEVSLEFNKVFDSRNRPIVAIMGLVGPSGPHAETFKRSMENPRENVCMSIRTFTDSMVRGGKVTKVLTDVITWDMVNEPGIESASKYRSPTLESSNIVVPRAVMEKAFIDQDTGVALECAAIDVTAMFKRLGWIATPKRTIVSGW